MRLQEIIKGTWDGGAVYRGQHLPNYRDTDIYSMSEPVSTDFDTDEYADDPMGRLEKVLGDKASVEYALSTLTDREQLVITMLYGLGGREPMSFEAVGAAVNKLDPAGGVGVHRERIRQIEAKALRKLRHPSRLPEPITEATAYQEKFLQNNDWDSPKQVAGWLRSKGFQKKGSGKFGSVYLRPGYENLIKISNIEDKCWLKFADWTLKITHNPSLPNIWWVRRYNDSQGREFFIALIEKLQPFNKVAINNTIDLPGLVYLYLYDFYEKGMTFSASMDANMENRFGKEGIIGPEDTNYDTIRRKLFYYLRTVKTGKRFIITLKAAERRAVGGCSYDMHDENLMYRSSDRRLVVIDPLADLAAIGGGY